MVTEFKFPDLGEGVTEGEIKKWLVSKGDQVEEDQSLAEVETDKAVVEVPSPEGGTILSLNFDEGDLVKVGEVIAVIGEEGETPEEAEEKEKKPREEAREEAEETEEAEEEKRESVSVVGELPEEEAEEILATPKVRKLAKELGVDLSQVKGSGPKGRITDEDVRSAGEKEKEKEEKKPKKVKKTPKFDMYGYVDRKPLKGVRRTTAKRMVESQEKAAQVTSMDFADVTRLVQLREREKEAVRETRGVNLTYMPFVVKALVEALKEHPMLNSSLNEEDQEIVIKKYYNIGVAVATEEGLIVPVIKGADQKSIFELAEEISRLAKTAASREIDLADLKGGTFTITNYGAFGGTYGTPIINYPEAAILGTGKIRDAPLVVDGEVRPRKVLHLSLTFDHRILDGAEAQKFLNTLIAYLEDPEMVLMS
ncbi:MAG: dihydrolipoamide acetyltransferase family protein [Methanomassiliicoccales archaeon]